MCIHNFDRTYLIDYKSQLQNNWEIITIQMDKTFELN